MNLIAQNLPQFWDKQGTNGAAWYLKLPVNGRDPTPEDPPIAGLTAAVVEVREKPGGELRFPAIDCTVDGETGLIEYQVVNNLVAAAGWETSSWKLIATINGEPYVIFTGRVTLGM